MDQMRIDDTPGVPDLEDERRKAYLTCWMFGIAAFVRALGVVSNLLQLGLLRRIEVEGNLPRGAAAANDARQALLGDLDVALFVVTTIALLLWLYRAYRNAQLVGSRATRFTAGWAVGWWFVPIVNLFRPYEILRELWDRSYAGNGAVGAQAAPGRDVVSWWWLAWVGAALGSRAVASAFRDATALADLKRFTATLALLDILWAISAVLAVLVVRGIDASQRRSFRTAAPAVHLAPAL